MEQNIIDIKKKLNNLNLEINKLVEESGIKIELEEIEEKTICELIPKIEYKLVGIIPEKRI